MNIAYCVDVSGSISGEHISAAIRFLERELKPKDAIIMFDIRAQIVSLDYLRDPKWHNVFLGGTDATEALTLCKQQGYSPVLISDGYLLEGQKEQFDKFIDMEWLVAFSDHKKYTDECPCGIHHSMCSYHRGV